MSAKPRMLFVNLAVKDLPRAKAFFSGLGFSFNPQFTDDKGACMVVSEQAFVMLLTEPFFQGFTKNAICDTARQTEGLFCFSCESRDEVDAIVKKAVETGGRVAMPPQDHGFMYQASFYDPDGHHWELAWMDMTAMPKG
jgi:predicted lactoylglutathione lyase